MPLKNLNELKSTYESMNRALSAAEVGTWEWHPETASVTWDSAMRSVHFADPKGDGDPQALMDEVKVHEDFEAMTNMISEAAKNKTSFSLLYRIKHPVTGDVRIIRSFGIYVAPKGDQSAYYRGIARDMSYEAEIQDYLESAKAQLISTSKLVALGEMAGSIAHEINNPLTIIQGRAFQLQEMAETQNIDPQKFKEAADSIAATTEKIAKIIKSLRSFSREGSQDPLENISFSEVIEETLELCRTRAESHGVKVTFNKPNIDSTVSGRIIQLEQVILNLMNNSFDAIEKLSEKWIQVDLGASKLQSLFGDEPVMELRITDSGNGIPESVQKEMMKPFFTTKDLGKGTGLGLSLSSEIVKSHLGLLYYDAAKEHTTFVVQIPQVKLK